MSIAHDERKVYSASHECRRQEYVCITIEEEETTIDDDEAVVVVDDSISLSLYFILFEPKANCKYR